MLYGSPYGRYGEAAFGGSTSPKDGGSAVSGPSDDVIALRHLRAGGGDCFGRLIARWSSFMHVSVYLEAESPCQFPVFQTTHFGALVRLLFHELLGLQLRRLLRWSSIGAREGFYLLCSLLLEPWIKYSTELGFDVLASRNLCDTCYTWRRCAWASSLVAWLVGRWSVCVCISITATPVCRER